MRLRVCVAAVVAVASLGAATPASAADRDCSDFSTQREAQTYYESKGGPASDPDRLDADDDGMACDALPCPCGSGLAPKPKPKPKARRIAARITSITDGDTLHARAIKSGRDYTVRLIGIDTPETKRPGTPVECGGPQASDNLRRLGFRDGEGVRVTLKTDPTQDKRDRYGRLLAYVTRRDGTNLGAAQIRAGWAEVYVFERSFKLVDRFRKAQAQARAADRGVWGECGGDFHRAAATSAAVKVCRKVSWETLTARRVSCRTARRVRSSTMRADVCPGSPCSATIKGRRWNCRAYNTDIYVWLCKARGGRRVRYAWLAGE